MNYIEHKRGATFSYSGLVKLPGSGWTAMCKLYRDETLAGTIAATLTALGSLGANGETHSLLLEASASASSTWPVAKLSGDIAFINGGVIVSTATFNVLVKRGYSNA